MCERAAAKEESYPTIPPRTQLNELLDKATESEDILSAWAKYGKNGNQAAAALMKWVQLALKKGNFKKYQPELMLDPRLQDMMNTISHQVSQNELIFSMK